MNHQQTLCWSVSALVQAVSDALKSRFATVSVKGEISGFMRAASGHCYFTLKDDSAQIRSVMFQRVAGMLTFAPKDGDDVEVQGRLAIYEARGDLQLIVESMRPVGLGRLLEQFLLLKNKLEGEGLFDAQRKRDIPAYPRAIGVVSSLQAAALHDVLTALKRRAPHVPVIVYPASVQGAQATAELVKAIQTASRRNEVDTLLVCRGGGSLEDLWCFNEEAVVRAIAASQIPVISGVGHETDFTLTDFVADLRAPTPTAAAELAAMRCKELQKQIEHLQLKLSREVRQRLDDCSQRIDMLALNLLHQPAAVLHMQQQRLTQAALKLRVACQQELMQKQQKLNTVERYWPLHVRERLRQSQDQFSELSMRWQKQAPLQRVKDSAAQLEKLVTRRQWTMKEQVRRKTEVFDAVQQKLGIKIHAALQQRAAHLENLDTRLSALNPQKILTRGYAWVTDEHGRVVSSVMRLQVGDKIQARFADGQAGAKVEQVEPDLLRD